MIDLHCHILPGVDDGPSDLQDSVAMARMAERDGVARVCATPHIRSDHEVRIPELEERVAQLNRELDRNGVATRVLTGGEVAEPLLGDLAEAELRAVSLGGGDGWILLEPPAGALDERIDRAVARLARTGLGTVLAHPERHLAEGSAELLAGIVGRGALVQATAAHLVDAATSPALLDLAGRGLIHLLGSDSHSSRGGRTPALRAGLQALGAVPRLAPHLDWIAEQAPRSVVAGRPVSPPFAPGP